MMKLNISIKKFPSGFLKYLIFVIYICIFTIQCVPDPRFRSNYAGYPREDKAPINDNSKQTFYQSGIASYMGQDLQGNKTANGEIFDMWKISAAHKTLPFGTVVRVKNLENGKQLNVRINDRGPFIKGRIIDLSYEAARQLDFINKGLAKVEITIVEKK